MKTIYEGNLSIYNGRKYGEWSKNESQDELIGKDGVYKKRASNFSKRLEKMKDKEDDVSRVELMSEEKDKFTENKKRVVMAQGRREDESDSD
ncbi:hypothetical protein RhiirA5_438440 [Rhizophagus irregularis]|uniref:Uncharacterized protein n=1 Tax=Rhizophagus irregularis TaxID=588596 RepID=A0A2I1EDK1_9GLOM|nr:hypothetical protein RhiirA5_438440 [Rhizophagus irregularis]PKC69858.1 hypothetical protein RhiirA1_455470 [Rhizophagus irregularis]PKY20213.1 hypothetical protein RhiirB3_433457 [Rhizophagus irregularis]